MAYGAVTSLMGTLSLHFLQSQPRFPLEDLESHIRYGNENLELLQEMFEDLESEMRDVYSKGPRIKAACLPRLHETFNRAVKKLISRNNNGRSRTLLTSRLREVGEVKQKIVSFHENLGFLQEFLEKSEIAYDYAVMKDLEAEIRDVSFEAEERIEMELSTIYLAKDSLRITASLLRLHGIFNEAVKQSDYLKNELTRTQSDYQLAKGKSKGSSQNEIEKGDVSLLGRMQRRGGLLLGSTSSHPADDQNISVNKISRNASKFDNKMVGCDEEFMTIMDQLTRQSAKQLLAVSIVGMGGIGKTTLAEKVYEDPSITSHFDLRAWVTVSQDYKVGQILQCLIGCVIAASGDEQSNNNQDQLAEHLRKRLKGQRYLIVIDDIWSTTAWDGVKRCFPDDNNGSRVLLTSRLREVAEYASSGNSPPLNMRLLDPVESWNLYCKVFGKTELRFEFEQIGRDIVTKCKGLPLAIIVVASLLSKTGEKVEKWKNFAENVSSYVIGDSNEACSRILSLSYNQLPNHLKACFLHFGFFPEDEEICVTKLVRLWAAVGFLMAVENQNPEEVAMECLQDLVDRSLVFISKQRYNGEMKTIRIHDLLRDLCLKEGGRQNLGNDYHDAIAGLEEPCCWVRLIYVIFNKLICDERLYKVHSFRYGSNISLEQLFTRFKLLRVLDLELCGWDDLYPIQIGLANLVHLRYVALFRVGCQIRPRVILSEHWNLQTFIVRGNDARLDSSEATVIWKMPLLRNLYVSQICSLGTPAVVHRNLETIYWLDPKFCTKDLLTKIPNLKKLGVGRELSRQNPKLFYNFVYLEKLEKLSISGWRLERIPHSGIPWGTSFLPNLKKLNLMMTFYLSWSDDMRLIGMLPNLEVLKLIHACQGPNWEPYVGEFLRLKRLVIRSRQLKHWNSSGDHFPVLERLELNRCNLLEEIPSGFADIATLALIDLDYCWDSVLASAKLIQDEQQSYGNDALLVRSTNIKPNRFYKMVERLGWDRIRIEDEESDE